MPAAYTDTDQGEPLNVDRPTPRSGLPPIDPSRLAEARARRDARRAAAPPATDGSHDQVILSSLAQQVSRLNTAAAASAERTELVEELQALIRSGDYVVDPDAIAAKLLDRPED